MPGTRRNAHSFALEWSVNQICEFCIRPSISIIIRKPIHPRQVLACDTCIQSPQSPHQRHAHAVTGLLLAAAATSSRIDAALATVLHRTDMVEEAMQFHLTVRVDRSGSPAP